MRQGKLTNRIMMLVLLAAVLTYLGVSAWRSFTDPYTIVTSYSYTVDDSLEATGFLVRDEQVVTSTGSLVELLPQEGEKVAKGGTVALLYQDAAGLERKKELQSLELEREQLQYALARTASGGDSAQLSSQVIDAIVDLKASVAAGDLTRLEELTTDLKSLVYKREYTFSDSEEGADAAAAIQASIDSVDAQIAALTAQAAQDTSRIRAPQSGIFSGVVDGYESLLDPDMLGEITPEQIRALSAQRPAPASDAIGKLIVDLEWYFVCALDAEDAERLTEGRKVTVRFSRDWSGEVDMTVERVGDTDENGQAAVVLSSNQFLSDTTLLRKQTVELVFETKTGVRVPKQAIRVGTKTVVDPDTEEESQVNVPGVFVLVGEQAEFKPVTVLDQQEGFALVEAAPATTDTEKKKALRPGDEIIISSGELFDGKVIH